MSVSLAWPGGEERGIFANGRGEAEKGNVRNLWRWEGHTKGKEEEEEGVLVI